MSIVLPRCDEIFWSRLVDRAARPKWIDGMMIARARVLGLCFESLIKSEYNQRGVRVEYDEIVMKACLMALTSVRGGAAKVAYPRVSSIPTGINWNFESVVKALEDVP